MYRRRGREPSKKWKHKTSFILKDLMFTSFKNLTLCFYRYNFSDVRVLEGVNIKSLSTNDVLCFHFLEGSGPLLRYIGWHENPPCDLPGADGARDRWHTSWNYPPYSELTQLTGTDWAYVATLIASTLGSPKCKLHMNEAPHPWCGRGNQAKPHHKCFLSCVHKLTEPWYLTLRNRHCMSDFWKENYNITTPAPSGCSFFKARSAPLYFFAPLA